MHKLLTKIFLGVLSVFLFAGVSLAADFTSVRLQQPESPTNQSTFNIVFVSLDTNSSQTISVQCYKKGPSDGGFVAFGSAINLTAGGNTDKCEVTGSVLNTSGTYSFEAIATGSTSSTSNIVSVDFNNSTGPGAPENYTKTKLDNCSYKINFRTANDSGKTVKVVLYRSTDSSFTADSSHQVNAINIGSNTDGVITDNVSPNCDTNYYYVIRAFDAYGNGSDLRGDSNTLTTIINPATTTAPSTQQGAIPVEQVVRGVAGTRSTGVLGTTEAPTATDASKEILESPEDKIQKEVVEEAAPGPNPINWILTHKKISLLVLFILVAIGVALYRNSRNKVV